MEDDDLKRRVAERLPTDGWTERDLDRAISTVRDHGLTDEEVVEKAVRRVCLVAGLDPGSVSDDGKEVLAAKRAQEAEPCIRQVREEVFGSPDPPSDSMGAVIRGWSVPAAVEDAARAVADATGFSETNVIRWIYTGERPPLSPAYVRTHPMKRQLPDGTWVRRKEARIVFHAPISRSEVLWAWRRISAFFEANGASGWTTEKRTRGPKVTDLDRHLWQLMEEMPEEGDATWPDRAAAWADLDPPDGWTAERWAEHRDVTPDALRIRWKRLQDKLKRLEPEEED